MPWLSALPSSGSASTPWGGSASWVQGGQAGRHWLWKNELRNYVQGVRGPWRKPRFVTDSVIPDNFLQLCETHFPYL